MYRTRSFELGVETLEKGVANPDGAFGATVLKADGVDPVEL
jgi:hypothetical protein